MKKLIIVALILIFVHPALAWQSNAVKKANDFLSAGMASEAIQALEDGIRETPKDHEAHWMLGELYLNSGSYTSAESRFNSAVRLKPSYKNKITNAYKKASDSALKNNDFRKVKIMHESISALDRNVSNQIENEIFTQGEALLDKGNIKSAERYFDLLTSLSGSYENRISDLFFGNKQYAAASKYSSKYNSEIHSAYIARMKASKSSQEYNEWREKALKYGDVIDYKLYKAGDEVEFQLRGNTETDHFIRIDGECSYKFYSSINKQQYELVFRDGKKIKIWAGEKIPDKIHSDFKIKAIKDVAVYINIVPFSD